ncbi:hypothetical protein MHU86_21817 [Fragilaria crotonensis]|nr:hypothetical protein MHU86_21817 [Fragilaria crotonensis]
MPRILLQQVGRACVLLGEEAEAYLLPQMTAILTTRTPSQLLTIARKSSKRKETTKRILLSLNDSCQLPSRLFHWRAKVSAVLTTDKTQYYEGAMIRVTYTMSSDNMEDDFAWIALFPCNVSDYTASMVPHHDATFGASGNSGTMTLSSRNMAALNSKYKAVMAVFDSNPLRILGVSSCFEVLPNPAGLATDKLHYNDAKSIEGTHVSVNVEVLRVFALAFILIMYTFVAKKKKKKN